MKTLAITFSCFFLLVTPLFSQVKMGKEWRKHQEFFDNAFGQDDPDFNISKAPEKFKDAPVVVLSQKLYLGFFYTKKVVMLEGTPTGILKGMIRKRVLIQEESAVKDFSEYYFGQSEVMGIQLIKADGSKQKIDLKDAIAVKTEVPKFYKSNFRKTKYYKIAIPNLKAGDILDFYTIFQEGHDDSSSSFVTTLSDSYPIVNNRVVFDIEKRWSFYHTSINGAAKFKEVSQGGVNLRGKSSNKVRRFALTQTDIPSQEQERWEYPYLTEPTIKIITYKSVKPKIAANKSFAQIPAPEHNPKSYAPAYGSFSFKSISKKEHKRWKTLPRPELINTIYNHLRLMIVPDRGIPLDQLVETSEQDNYRSMSEGYFAAAFRNALNQFDIYSQLVYVVPTYYGALEDALAIEERAIGVYIKQVDQYYFAPNNYSKPGEIPTYLNNASALILPKPSSTHYNSSDLFKGGLKVKLPTYQSKENLFAAKLTLTLSDDLMEQVGELKLRLDNRYRRSYSSMFLSNLEYRETDEAKFETGNKYTIGDDNWDNTKARTLKVERGKLRNAAVKRYFQADYAIEELTNCQILKEGRYGEEPLEVQLDFTAKDLVKKAGKNYIFSAGSLIGEQVELDQAEITERANDIHFGTAKLITNYIEVKIPSNFKVEGLDNLKFKLDNKYMTFISTAKIEGNSLIIGTKKEYKKATVPAAEWAEVVAILEAAYEFTQAKVVLKKRAGSATVGGEE